MSVSAICGWGVKTDRLSMAVDAMNRSGGKGKKRKDGQGKRGKSKTQENEATDLNNIVDK